MLQWNDLGPTPRPSPRAFSSPALPSQPFAFFQQVQPLFPCLARIIGLRRSKELLIDFLPVDRVKRKAMQNRIHHPEVSVFLAPSHLIREPVLAILGVYILIMPHCCEEGL